MIALRTILYFENAPFLTKQFNGYLILINELLGVKIDLIKQQLSMNKITYTIYKTKQKKLK